VSSWIGSAAAWVAAAVAVISVYVNWRVNSAISDRTVTVEAQKLLLEMNKQYISDTALLALEGEASARTLDPEAKLRAMAYFKLNVFEIIFAAVVDQKARKTWTRYFEVSLTKSALLGEELEKNRDLYHQDLQKAYDKWKSKSSPGR
jgi:hypothetical protein